MSDIVEKTLASFPKFLSENLLGGNYKSNQNAPPRVFQNFVNMVNNVQSKFDEEQLVCREMQTLQKALSQPNISSTQLCEYLCRLVFCSMLGYDVSFCHIHAVKLAQKGTGVNKRIGYMSVALLLHENHEMIVLLINTIQKDLKSSNLLDNYVALTAASQLVNTESIPLVLPLVLEKLKHPRELLRARATQCLHRMFIRAPSLLQHHQSTIQAMLSDRDPSVIRAVLHILTLLVQDDPERHLSLGESLVEILRQVIHRTFPPMCEYHNLPLPWMQIQLLRILGSLGAVSQSLSHQMYPLLSEVLKRNKVRENMAYAVLYEGILTITAIKEPPRELLSDVSTCITRFLKSSSHNLRYLGIKALTSLTGIDPVYATSHQITVVECLDEEDEAIQRKTLTLLQGIANSANVQAICGKLLEQVSKSTDIYFKMETANRIAHLAEKLLPDVQWYIETMHSVLVQVSDSPDIDKLAATMVKFIDGRYEQFDETFQLYLLVKYLACLQDTTTPAPVLKFAVWIVGKTSENLKVEESSRVISPVVEILSHPDQDEELCALALSVLTTLVVRQAVSPESGSKLWNCDNLPLKAPYLKQRMKELRQLIKHSVKIPKLQYSHEMDFTLSFLDDDVAMAIEHGASPYRPKILRQSQHETTNAQLSASEYESLYHQVSPSKSSSTHHDSVQSVQSGNSSESEKTEHGNRSAGLNMSGVRRVWGQEGLVTREGPDAAGEKNIASQLSIQENEKLREKHQLAEALFEGVDKQQATASWFSEDSVKLASDEEFSIPKCDSSKWKKIHQEHQSVPTQQDTLANNQSFELSTNDISPTSHDHTVTANEIAAMSHDQNSSTNEIGSDLNDVHQVTDCPLGEQASNLCESERRELSAQSLQCTDSVEMRRLETASNRNDAEIELNDSRPLRKTDGDDLLPSCVIDLFSGLTSQTSEEQTHTFGTNSDQRQETDHKQKTEDFTQSSQKKDMKPSIYDEFLCDEG